MRCIFFHSKWHTNNGVPLKTLNSPLGNAAVPE